MANHSGGADGNPEFRRFFGETRRVVPDHRVMAEPLVVVRILISLIVIELRIAVRLRALVW